VQTKGGVEGRPRPTPTGGREMSELPRIEIHISANVYVKPGEGHLLIAHKDWQVVHEFFAKHFELWEPIMDSDGWATGYRQKISGPKP